MKKLSTTGLMLVSKHMEDEARPLEKALYNFYFHKGDSKDVFDALIEYQNEDGGFGKGIEPDFWLPESSPMATSIGLKYLKLCEHLSEGKESIRRAIEYLEASYNVERKGWFSVPKTVNNYPHAPWWTFDETTNMTMIDQNWGNPSAELIGYLYHYKKYLKHLDVKELIEYCIYHYNHISEFESEHEVYCYIRLYNQLKPHEQVQLEYKIKQAVNHLINPDIDQWTTYVPMPLNFVEMDSENLFDMKVNDINKNLNYFVEILEKNEHIEPVWMWNNYPDEWQVARKRWTGILTLETMMKLKRFERV